MPGNVEYYDKTQKETMSLDSNRARMIIQSPETIQVLYNGSPVWLENVKDNNTVEVTYLENRKRAEVPVNRLIESR